MDLKSWKKNKYQCAKCATVIYSKYSGEFVSCKCGAIAVDQTEHYERRIGNKEDFIDTGTTE